MYETKEEVLQKAIDLVRANVTFGEIDINHRITAANKGDLGQVVEEGWYGISINNRAEPDFPKAGVELKVIPYLQTKNGPSAKERLSANIINYMEDPFRSFEDSSFWHKCRCICLIIYLYQNNVKKWNFKPSDTRLLDGYPEEDLLIIKNDYEILMDKIREGKAEELSDSLTQYLGAMPKGSKALANMRKQPFSEKKAQQRAFDLKGCYVTRLLRKYFFGGEENEHIIRDVKQLRTESFENIILRTINSHIGKSVPKLCDEFCVDSTAKNLNHIILSRMFGVSDISKTEEFISAGIYVKTIRIDDGKPCENMSFPAFRFLDIANQEWEESDLYELVMTTRFLFVVFEKRNDVFYLRSAKFWCVPLSDVEIMKGVWEDTKRKIIEGVKFEVRGKKVYNDFIPQSAGRLIHIRPHTDKSAYKLNNGFTRNEEFLERYANPLPSGEWMTTQCFWFNIGYIRRICV